MLSSSDLLSEITFSTSRSSGPGGQSVNTTDSKVTLRFDVRKSTLLSEGQKSRLLLKFSNRMSKEGVVIISSQVSRSQLDNKKKVLQRFDALLKKAFQETKKRRRSRPSRGAIERRLKDKRVNKEKKDRRKPI